MSGCVSVEFVNVGGWLPYGDMALDSCAQFLAVAEHRFFPGRVGPSVTSSGIVSLSGRLHVKTSSQVELVLFAFAVLS